MCDRRTPHVPFEINLYLSWPFRGTNSPTVLAILSGERQSRADTVAEGDQSDSDTDSLLKSFNSASEISLLVQDISQTVDCLYRVSIYLTKQSFKDRYAKSAEIDVSGFEQYDLEHVRQKYPDAKPYLISRIGKSISKRRQYLKYREQHAIKIAQDLELVEGSYEVDNEDTHTTLSETTATTFVELQEFEKTQLARRQSSAASILSDTTYSSLAGDGERLRMPALPEGAADQEPFVCPICHKLSQLETVRTTHEWTKHVFRDLQPYTCTFEDCPLGGETFESRHLWFNHELKLHRRSWICRGHCNESFQSYEDFQEHVQEFYPQDIAPSQLSTFIDMCAVPFEATVKSDCPLCECVVTGSRRLEKHLGRHMEEIALFALPQSLFEDGGDLDSDNSSDASGDDPPPGPLGDDPPPISSVPPPMTYTQSQQQLVATGGTGIESPFGDAEGKLPAGWERRNDNLGRSFYVDHNTRKTQWNRPGGPDDPTDKSDAETGGDVSASAASGDNELPPQWEQRYTAEGRAYFVDHDSRTTTWVDPRRAKYGRDSGGRVTGSLGPLPSGWEMRLTATARVYFVNHNTKETTWDDPRLTTIKVSANTRESPINFSVRLADGVLFRLIGYPSDTVAKVKRRISEERGTPEADQILLFDHAVLKDHLTLGASGFNDKTTLALITRVTGPGYLYIYLKLLPEIFLFRVSPSDPMVSLKFRLESAKGTATGAQILTFQGQEVDNMRTIQSYGIKGGADVHVRLRSFISMANPQEVFSIFISDNGLAGGKFLELRVTGLDLVETVKAKIREQIGVTAAAQVLLYSGNMLSSHRTLESYQIPPMSCLTLRKSS